MIDVKIMIFAFLIFFLATKGFVRRRNQKPELITKGKNILVSQQNVFFFINEINNHKFIAVNNIKILTFWSLKASLNVQIHAERVVELESINKLLFTLISFSFWTENISNCAVTCIWFVDRTKFNKLHR